MLDADSLMTGECIVRLALAMEADPDAGIIQTLPLIINRNTFFARVQQFAARVYGPVIATGLSTWMGRDGNYWGHNAIIRTKAFAAHAGLPDLKGKPPLGGHILSHDFVEAALIRRAGWTVYMLPDLGGSYEESPPSLIDLVGARPALVPGQSAAHPVSSAPGPEAADAAAFRDRDHVLSRLAVLAVPAHRRYRSRPADDLHPAGIFQPRFPPLSSLAAVRSRARLMLFAVTMGILLAPKVFGLRPDADPSRGPALHAGAPFASWSRRSSRSCSRRFFAPILMLIQSGSVFQILLGRDTGWQPQRRDDGSIPIKDIVRRHRWHALLGASRASRPS